MRIVDRKTFMKFPIGTVFSYYEPNMFRELNIKCSTGMKWEDDFLLDYIIGSIESDSSDDSYDKYDRMEKGESMSMDFESTDREGLYEQKQLFAIYEKADVEKLIKRLKEALEDTSRANNKEIR